MTKFITVTSKDSGRPVFVRSTSVTSVAIDEEWGEKSTRVNIGTTGYLHVTEKPVAVVRMIEAAEA